MGKGVSKGVIWWLALAVGTMAQLGLSPAVESATATATPTSYKITFTVNFRNQTTGLFFATPVLTGTDIDITGVNPNSNVSNSLVNVAIADYDKGKVIMNCAVKLKGSVTFDGTTYVTTSGGGVATSGAAAEGSYNFPASVCTPPNVTIESPVFNPALKIGGQITLKFNAANSLELNFTGVPPNGPVLSPGQFDATLTSP